jgi:hypothetical protein
MNKHLYFIIVLLCNLKTSAQQVNADTNFILRETNGRNYHAIFIDTNKQSTFYEHVLNFCFDDYDSASYDVSINYIVNEQKIKLKRSKIASSLPRNWSFLHNYKNKLYLYAPSDWGNNSRLIITDSTFVEYSMDGPTATAIKNFKAINKNSFEFLLFDANNKTNKVTLHMLDWANQIAVLYNHSSEEKYRYELIVGAAKAKSFPIIVNYSRYNKQREFVFDKIDFKNVFANGLKR